MRGSWNRTIKPAANPAELVEVASWLIPQVGSMPAEALDWIIADGPEPWWLSLWPSLAQANGDQGQPEPRPDVNDIRGWRDEIRTHIDGDQLVDTWIESAMLDQTPVSIQVHSTEVAGRWSGFTLASFGSSPDESADRAVGDDAWWIRFEPEGERPVTEWLIVVSSGWSARVFGSDDTTVRVEIASQTADGQTTRRGDAVVEAQPERVDAALQDVLLDNGRVKRLDLSLEPQSSSRARVSVEGSARLKPLWLEFLSPSWPLVRPFVSRRLGREATRLLDEGQASQPWQELLAAARTDQSS